MLIEPAKFEVGFAREGIDPQCVVRLPGPLTWPSRSRSTAVVRPRPKREAPTYLIDHPSCHHDRAALPTLVPLSTSHREHHTHPLSHECRLDSEYGLSLAAKHHRVVREEQGTLRL